MINLAQLRAWRASAPNFIERQRKILRQTRYGWSHPKQVSFVFGCQRSGTKMLMRILDRSPATRIYHENHATAFTDFELRPDPVLRALVQLNPAPSQIFKPICDSQNADLLLARFPNAHGVWIYRHYDDVANSAWQKWGEHQRELVDAVVRGDLTTWGWRTARLPESVIADLKRVHRTDLTPQEGALLFWYMRNAFFFALGVHENPRMLLKNYEELVQSPEAAFQEVFDHVGAPFDPTFLERVRDSSVGRKEAPNASAEIRALCADLMARLDAWRRLAPAAAAAAGVGAGVEVPGSVLMLINTLGVGGAERYAVTVSNWLAEHGSKVTIAASEGGGLVAALRPDVEYVPAPFRRVRHDLPVAARQVRGMLAARHPDVIVCHSLAMTWIARAAQVRRHVPIVNIAHGWPDDRYAVVGKLMRVADVVVAVSPEVKAKLVAGGLAPERCEVIFNGVDCTGLGRREGEVRTAVRASLGAGPEDVLVVTLGRLTPQKAHHHVVTAAERLRTSHPNVRFAIVGEGARFEELQGLVQAAGLADRVALPGLRTDVPDLLGAADVYLSCSDWEGMPLSTIEAMASELPTVATKTEGSGQLLSESCGIVVPVGDAGAMAGAVAKLADNPALRATMGAAARERALASFGHERMAAELAAVLMRVVRRG
ncbi:hypothetical protein LBMAG42_54560 [Deltaproteobacteria bacterium]|nr:hypothetical protein LBMAG42_54560 [Deltaproteobacteria bacterium]